jgi:predicted nucleic acid-binding protein
VRSTSVSTVMSPRAGTDAALLWFSGGVEVLRCLIDSMVFDAIAGEAEMLADVDRLTSARHLELLAAAETMAEITATPDAEHRRRLQRVRVLVVPPAEAGDEAMGHALTGLRTSAGVSEEDAHIALAAALQDVPLVTEDRDLRLAAAEHLPAVRLWRWETELRPRIVTLAEDHPAPVRRSPRRS